MGRILLGGRSFATWSTKKAILSIDLLKNKKRALYTTWHMEESGSDHPHLAHRFQRRLKSGHLMYA